MNLLLSNDDGIRSPGLMTLAVGLKEAGNILVVAPQIQQSGISNAITLFHPLRLEPEKSYTERFGVRAYSLTGTPTDCVKLGIHVFPDFKPDLVLVGINEGYNMASDILYSGTVGAATEACLYEVPSIAVSIGLGQDREEPPYETAVYWVKKVLERYDISMLPKFTFLNINVPPLEKEEIKGIKVTTLGVRRWRDSIVESKDPRNSPYYWMYSGQKEDIAGKNTDIAAVEEGYVSVTPILLDRTDQKTYAALQKRYKEK